MKIGEIKFINNIRVIAVYDNSIRCDRCDFFDVENNTTFDECTFIDVDCGKDEIVFKKVLTK